MNTDTFVSMRTKIFIRCISLLLWQVLGCAYANPTDEADAGTNEALRQLRSSPSAANSKVLQTLQLLLETTKSKPKNRLSPDHQQQLLATTANHPSWKNLAEQLRQSSYEVDRAKSSLMPKVYATADAGTRRLGDNPVYKTEGYEYKSTNVQLGVRQLLYDSGASFNMIDAAVERKESTKARVVNSESELLLSIMNTVYERQRLSLLGLWESSIAIERNKVQQQAAARHSLGSGTIYDFARAKSKAVESELGFKYITSQTKSIEEYLRSIGVNENFMLPSFSYTPQAMTPTDVAWEHQAVLEASKKLNALKLEYEAEKSRKRPQAYLDVSTNKRKYASPYEGATVDGSAIISLSYDVYTGGYDTSSLAITLTKMNQAEADLENIKLDVANTIARSRNELETLRSNFQLMQESVRMAADGYIASKELFEYRKGSLVDIQRNEDELSGQVRKLINAWIDLSITSFRLAHQEGRLTHLVHQLSQ